MSHVYCPECGFQNPEAANYCSKCGSLLRKDDPDEQTMTFTPGELADDARREETYVEPLPDLATLSDDDLKALIEKLEAEEDEVSYRRRLLQGRIDILRAERTARLKGAGVGDVDVDRLTDILATRGAPVPPAAGGDEAS